MTDFTSIMREPPVKKRLCPDMYKRVDGLYSCKAIDDGIDCFHLNEDDIECEVYE